ncbi:MAG: DUF2520 domain-containing protein [Cyclobacteriaceae bacterium]|nr:DUF2520 domain-containing protein [Cyclobacteriaceae bacterium]
MDVSFIGAGNLAWHLAPALDNAGYVVREVYSRNPRHAEALTERLYQADVKASLDFSTSKSRLFVIATSDDAIEQVAMNIVLPDNALLIHCSGGQPLSVLQYAAATHTGVLYPLQTFSKAKRVDFKTIPLFVECSTEESERLLMALARTLSHQVRKTTSEERKALHVAAVFASNFPNHMLAIAKSILKANGLEFDLVKPLIQETISKALQVGPEQSQTGPAFRGDLEVLDRHMEFLQEDEQVAEIYRIISQHIVDTYGEEG